MANWLEELVSQHAELESPVAFWRWSALAAISAVLQDHVWIDRGGLYKLYPNIYVMLHADSGLKKGPPVSMAKQLVSHAIGSKIIISGRSSIQGILKHLGTSESAPGGKIVHKSKAFICSSELTSSLVEDKAALEILTDLYDRNYNVDDWSSLLKSDSFAVSKPTITMLTATNEAHSEEFFTKKDVQGGYIARTFIIYEKKRNRVNSLMKRLTNPPDYKKSAEYLKELHALHGEIGLTDEAKSYYDAWYHEFTGYVDSIDISDSTGTLNRFGDSVLKVGLLLSLADSKEMIITDTHLRAAVALCESLVGNVRKATMGRGKYMFSSHKAALINELLDRPGHVISWQMLNKKFGLWASSNEWKDIIEDLQTAGALKIEMQGPNMMISMPEATAKEWKEHLAGKRGRK